MNSFNYNSEIIKTLRWILFLPISFLVGFLALALLYNLLDPTKAFSILPSSDSENILAFCFRNFTSGVASSYLYLNVGCFIAPSNKKTVRIFMQVFLLAVFTLMIFIGIYTNNLFFEEGSYNLELIIELIGILIGLFVTNFINKSKV